MIEDAAEEFGVDNDLLKAIIYTEEARGGYDRLDPHSIVSGATVLPGNLYREWEKLIPGSSVSSLRDNLRLSAKLISEIQARLDDPKDEDVYSLYNGMAHDRTFHNKQLKSTPFFVKKAKEEKAWEFEDWSLGVRAKDVQARAKWRIGSGPEPADADYRMKNQGGPGAKTLTRVTQPPPTPNSPALSTFSRPVAENRKRQIEWIMRVDRDGYFQNEDLQAEYRKLLERLHGTST